jgi:hypothetical protein
MAAIGFVGLHASALVGALDLAWLYLASRASILAVAAFHAVFEIAAIAPTDTPAHPRPLGRPDAAPAGREASAHRRCLRPVREQCAARLGSNTALVLQSCTHHRRECPRNSTA